MMLLMLEIMCEHFRDLLITYGTFAFGCFSCKIIIAFYSRDYLLALQK